MAIIINKRPGKCASCTDPVAPGKGYAYKFGHKWQTVCTSTACQERLGVKPPSKEDRSRKLLIVGERGHVQMPFDRQALTLLRSLPGAKFMKLPPGSHSNQAWTCSIHPNDLPRVLEIADKLQLDVPEELRKTSEQGTEEYRQAKERAHTLRTEEGHTLRSYQIDGVEFLARHNVGILADEMGTGKTPTTIVALPNNAAVLVICPASVKYNWENEFHKWRPEFKTDVRVGKDSFRLPEKGEVVIVNFDLLPEILDQKKNPVTRKYEDKYEIPQDFLEKIKGIHLIVDEIQNVKNYNTKRSMRVGRISKEKPIRWGLSGTPLDNRPPDLYGCLASMGAYPFGKFTKFAELFNACPKRFGGYEWGDPTPEVSERLRKVMLRRTKAEVLKDLPPKQHQIIQINGIDDSTNEEMDKILIKMCVKQGLIIETVPLSSDIIESNIKAFKEKHKRDPKQDEIKTRRRKTYDEWDFTPEKFEEYRDIARENADLINFDNMPKFEEMERIRTALAVSRIPAVEEMVVEYEDVNTPVVVFSDHLAPVNKLAKREGWAKIDGSTNPKRRQEIIDEFQAGKLKGVALTIKTGGVGINLTRASDVIFVDRNWRAMLNIQAEDRVHRISQNNAVNIKILTGNHPLDVHISNLIEKKIQWAREALDERAKFTKPREYGDGGVIPESEIKQETLEELEARIQKKQEEETRRFYKDKISKILGRERLRSHIPEPKLTSKRIALIKEGLEFMCSRCDGAVLKDGEGFNKPDAAIGHWLNAAGLEDETTIRVAERVLSRYHTQLVHHAREDIGRNFKAIWVPDLET